MEVSPFGLIGRPVACRAATVLSTGVVAALAPPLTAAVPAVRELLPS